MSERESLKQKYGWLYESLTQLLAEYDPMGLVSIGAPYDEYDIEVDRILLRLPETTSPKALGQLIYETFVACFGSSFALSDQQPSKNKYSRFKVLGEKAWTLWQRWKKESQQ